LEEEPEKLDGEVGLGLDEISEVNHGRLCGGEFVQFAADGIGLILPDTDKCQFGPLEGFGIVVVCRDVVKEAAGAGVVIGSWFEPVGEHFWGRN